MSERFVKAIRQREAQKDDIVLIGERPPERVVLAVHYHLQAAPELGTDGPDIEPLSEHPDRVIGLVHRPDETGRTREDRRIPIVYQVSQLIAATAPWDEEAFDRTIDALLEAIEYYKLSEPLELPKPASKDEPTSIAGC